MSKEWGEKETEMFCSILQLMTLLMSECFRAGGYSQQPTQKLLPIVTSYQMSLSPFLAEK